MSIAARVIGYKLCPTTGTSLHITTKGDSSAVTNSIYSFMLRQREFMLLNIGVAVQIKNIGQLSRVFNSASMFAHAEAKYSMLQWVILST